MTITPTQTATANAATKTITATTGPNHSLVVCVGSWGSGVPSISAVTLGAVNLSLAASIIESGSDKAVFVYYKSGIATGQTAVAITGANLGLTTSDGGVIIYEVPSLLTLDSPVVKTASGTSGSWSSGATGALSQAHEFVIGVAETGATINSPSGWTNTKPSGNFAIAGYTEVTDGSSQTYNAASSTQWAAAIVPFKIPGNNPGAFLPFIARR